MSEVLIKKRGFELKVKKEELVEVHETADGVAFHFKDGITLIKDDPYMPSGTKQLIKNTIDRFESGNITIDLDNQKQPARVDM